MEGKGYRIHYYVAVPPGIVNRKIIGNGLKKCKICLLKRRIESHRYLNLGRKDGRKDVCLCGYICLGMFENQG